MRALITGVSGFVGQYLAANLLDNGYEVWGGTRKSPPCLIPGVNIIELDFSKQSMLEKMLEQLKPDVIFHLSGQSSVKYSWDNIDETFQSNLLDTIKLLDAIKNTSIKHSVKIISVGSSEEYGLVNELPIVEDTLTNPINPYGLSKLAISKLAPFYNKLYGLNIIHARAFNHIGPGQMLGFVTSDFAKQVVDIELGKTEPTLYVGDLSSKRDFTDVRDIVEAYRLLFEKGVSGEIYNVCSGDCISMQHILNVLTAFSTKPIEVIVDKQKLRPSNIKEYYGSSLKLQEATGWQPTRLIEDSLHDIYCYWKQLSVI